MSETPKESEKDELTISKIYETLKSRHFLRSLYWDVLSDLKEKPTFKRMRKTIRQLVHEKLKVIENLPANEFTSKLEKKIASEVCSLTITADIVCSKILHVKIGREFRPYIVNIIRELRHDGEIPDEVWAELEIPNLHDENIKKTDNSAKQKTESAVKSPSMPAKKEKENVACSEDEKLQNQGNVTKNDTESEKKLAQNKMETTSLAASKKTSPKRTLSEIEEPKESSFSPSTSKKKSPRKSNNEDDEIEIDVVNPPADEKESDAESDISIGRISITSVSSVHTSDLSSFDDEVSISSRDGTRMRVSLNEALAETVAGKINGFGKILTKGQYQHHLPEQSSAAQEQLDHVMNRINIPALLLGYENIHRPRPEELPEVENPRPNRRGRNRVQEHRENRIVEIPRGRNFQERRANRLLERSRERNVQGYSHRHVPEESQAQDIHSFERKRGRNLREQNHNNTVVRAEVQESHQSSAPENSEIQENKSDSGTSEDKISVETTDKPDEAAANELFAYTSSKRVRKPNSKYSSDSIICHSVKVKDRKKSALASNADEKSDESSPKRKRPSTEVETPNKIQKMYKDQETKSSDDKAVPSTSKQSESADLYKPTSSARPLTSRKTAPVTLYSTTPKPSSSTDPINIKKKN